MMKNNNFIFLMIISLSLLSACQSVKEGLTGQKQTNSDEFLVQKKNPLVLPPDYNELPQPKSEMKAETEDSKENKEIKEIEDLISSSSEGISEADTELEEFILKKINENNN